MEDSDSFLDTNNSAQPVPGVFLPPPKKKKPIKTKRHKWRTIWMFELTRFALNRWPGAHEAFDLHQLAR